MLIITFIFGAITKAFIVKIPNRFIPLQNCLIGLISAILCSIFKLAPNFGESLLLCLMATMSAGGTAELVKIVKPKEKIDN